MGKLIIIWISICLILLPNYQSIAQQYSFKNYSLEEGLPQSEVFSLIQDKKGNLWLGTNGGGISRFNGTEFVSYDRKHGLADNNIRALYQDSNSILWIGTSKCISSFNGVSFVNYEEKDSVPNAVYLRIQEDNKGRIWAYGFDQNDRYILYREDGKFKDFIEENSKDLNRNQVRGFFLDHEGTVFIISLDGLYEYKNDKLSKSSLNDIPEFAGQIIVPILVDDSNQLWFANFVPNSGFRFYKTQDGKPEQIKLPAGIQVQNLGAVTLDSEQRLWISVLGTGVLVINGEKSKLIDGSKGLVTPFINNIVEDREGNIWLTTSGNGLIKYGNNKFQSLDFTSDLGGNIVRAILQDSKR